MENKLKISKRLVILLIISLIIPVTILADTVAFKTVVSKNDMTTGGDFWLDVQMQITAGTSPRTLNSFTADIYYTSTISYNGSGECVWAFSVLNGYTDITAADLSGYVRLGCTGGNVGAVPGWDGWNVTTSWQTVVTLKLTIATATSVNISINDATDAAAYFNNIANNPTGAVTDWTVTNEDGGDITLPVELTAFSAVYTINESGSEFVSVNWSTASETDFQGFNIYRSENDELSMVGNHINSSLISGAGTTTEPQHYSFIDDVANPYKIYYYWLESVDFGGISEYYGPVKYVPGDSDGDQEVDLYSKTMLYNSYPNPATHTTTIKYQLKGSVIEQNAVISIYNIKGESVKKVEGTKGKAEIDLSGLSTGIYLYKLDTNDYHDVKKMIIME